MNQRENPLLNLTFNIVIPIVILNKGHLLLGSDQGVLVLLIALVFPVIYGSWDFIKHKRKNIISAFGILNILLTGGLALYKLDGIWFAVKEASFPLLIGIFVLASVYTRKSFFEYLISTAGILKWSLIEERVQNFSSIEKLKSLMRKATALFSISFFISAILNFVLALYIFLEKTLDNISEAEREIILNKKIADMTWLGFVVIGMPMAIFSILVFWYFLKKLSQITELPIEQMLVHPTQK